MSAPAIPPEVAAAAVADCKAYLRIAQADEDAAIAGFAATALGTLAASVPLIMTI